MRLALVLLAVAGAAGLAWWLLADRAHRPGSAAWRAVGADLSARFADVPTVSTDALAARLAAGDAPLLLDAREPAEYAVSHLPGAVRVDPDASAGELAAALDTVARGRPVVVYCSVGVRSAGVARRLQASGFERVANLEGSIFRWANEGRPVVRDGAEVEAVHPFDAVWGRLLAPDLRADPS